MKILYMYNDPGIPLFGRKGCSTHARETCQALSACGHEVQVVCSNLQGDDQAPVDFKVHQVQPPTSRKLGFDLRHIWLDRNMRRRLKDLMRQWRPDALYERYSLYGRAGHWAARHYQLPHLLEVNAFLTREQERRIKLPWLARRSERGIIRRATGVIVVSESLREEVHSLGVPLESIHKMPMAVDLQKFHPSVDGTDIRKKLNLEDRFVIGYVGTLTAWHGISLLYNLTFKLLHAEAPKFVILVVGGEQRRVEDHRRKVKAASYEDQMRFIGSVPHQEVPAYIRAMDLTLVPDTTYWSSPAKLFEYQASGKPVLAPDYPSIREMVEHGREGYLFEPNNTDQIAACILELMQQPERMARMADASRRRVQREHSWTRNAEIIVNLFEELRAGRAKPV